MEEGHKRSIYTSVQLCSLRGADGRGTESQQRCMTFLGGGGGGGGATLHGADGRRAEKHVFLRSFRCAGLHG